jgi:hypothetical protein
MIRYVTWHSSNCNEKILYWRSFHKMAFLVRETPEIKIYSHETWKLGIHTPSWMIGYVTWHSLNWNKKRRYWRSFHKTVFLVLKDMKLIFIPMKLLCYFYLSVGLMHATSPACPVHLPACCMINLLLCLYCLSVNLLLDLSPALPFLSICRSDACCMLHLLPVLSICRHAAWSISCSAFTVRLLACCMIYLLLCLYCPSVGQRGCCNTAHIKEMQRKGSNTCHLRERGEAVTQLIWGRGGRLCHPQHSNNVCSL